MNPEILLQVDFSKEGGEGMGAFRFSHFPRIGEKVATDEFLYEVKDITHCEGESTDGHPHAIVTLHRVRSLGE